MSEITYENGDKYFGEVKDEKKNGHGIYTWPNGSKYVGDWKDDQQNGHGIYTWLDGDKYLGDWKDGKKNGYGIFTWPDGSKYVGDWKDDQQNGHGTTTMLNGDIHVGRSKDGLFNGQGTYTFGPKSDYAGVKFKSFWKNGEKIIESDYSKNIITESKEIENINANKKKAIGFQWEEIFNIEEMIALQAREQVLSYIFQYYNVENIENLTKKQISEIIKFKDEELSKHSNLKSGFNDAIAMWESDFW